MSSVVLLKENTERIIEKQRDLYIYFIDFEKAFDRVRHVDQMEALKNIEVNGEGYTMIKELYWTHKASVWVKGEETEGCPKIGECEY